MPTASGQYAGRALKFYSFVSGSRRNRQIWQAMSLSCANPGGLRFELGAQNVVTSAIGAMMGMEDLVLGDAAFDKRFLIGTNAPQFPCAALTPELRSLLLRQWSDRSMGACLKVYGGAIVYAECGAFTEGGIIARMRAMLEPMALLAALPEAYRR